MKRWIHPSSLISTKQAFYHTKFNTEELRSLQYKPRHSELKARQLKFLQKTLKNQAWKRPTWHRVQRVTDRALLIENRLLITSPKWWHCFLLTEFRRWHRLLPVVHMRFLVDVQNKTKKWQKREVKSLCNWHSNHKLAIFKSIESQKTQI